MSVTNLNDLSDTSPKTKDDSLKEEILIGLASIYTFVKSRELTKTLSSYTFDDYIYEAKEQIKSEVKGTRSTKIDRLSSLEEKISKVIDQAKQLKKDTKKEE